MTNDTKNAILKFLFGLTPKADKLKSIDEKRRFYIEKLEKNLDCIDTEEEIDPYSKDVEELITDNFLYTISNDTIIFEDEGYIPWLEDSRKEIIWNYYYRYERYLFDEKGWNIKTITSLKKNTDIILDHISNPKSNNCFGKIGLVIGDIQSGKTASYTALINKALDAGYKLIIVFAGLTRDLRNQTQKRLDREVLGFETKNNGKGNSIGVGKIKQLKIEGLTYADENKDYGDLKKYFSTHTLDDDMCPIVAIVKKNKNVLEHLDKFLTSSQHYCYTNNKLNIPVLIIDDEVDQASVDTKNGDELKDASTINKTIRTILSHLNRYSYVGYTATPFANIFINPDRKETDIYPKDFMINLPVSDDYCGIKEFFGVDIFDDDEETTCDRTLDLFCEIKDFDSFFQKNERLNVSTDTICLNASLKKSILSFILVSSIKKARGINEHNSMLIHIAKFKNPQNTLKPKVVDFIDDEYRNLKYEYNKQVIKYKELWENDFKEISEKRLKDKFNDNWDIIKTFLLSTIESIQSNIIVLNGDSNDVLDYYSSKTGDYIIIGGDKLSRGLTLEGLTISYYYRDNKAYDSHLQMGRWFGYRKKYIDLCRVYTSKEYMNNFIIVGKVLQRFKKDISEMNLLKLNPRDVGQRILYSPNLIPTERKKMKTSIKIKISFSGQIQQVITFDRKYRNSNFELTNNLINSLKNGIIRGNKIVFKNISSDVIINYLENYKDCSDYYEYGNIDIKNWINYIRNLNKNNELTNWTIVLNSLKSDKDDNNKINIGKYTIYKPSRTLRDAGDSSKFELYTVKTIIDPTDFKEVFEPNTKEYNEVKHYCNNINYSQFDSSHGLMSLYVMDLYEKELINEYDEISHVQKSKRGKIIDDAISICAPAIWFPNTKDYDKSATYYYVNEDYLKN